MLEKCFMPTVRRIERAGETIESIFSAALKPGPEMRDPLVNTHDSGMACGHRDGKSRCGAQSPQFCDPCNIRAGMTFGPV